MTISDIKKDTRFWQRLLRLGGYEPGVIDGIEGKNTRAAAERWAAAEAIAKERYGVYDARSEGTLATCLPSAQAVLRQWLKVAQPAARAQGLEVLLINGTRSFAEQDALYAQGRTALGAKVTNARGGYSWHNFGLAADMGVFRDGKYLGSSPVYAELGKLARNIPGLEWGGDWTSFRDEPHLQMAKFASTAAARAVF